MHEDDELRWIPQAGYPRVYNLGGAAPAPILHPVAQDFFPLLSRAFNLEVGLLALSILCCMMFTR
jgi:hypothetical protein